jgi:hypothetical protein
MEKGPQKGLFMEVMKMKSFVLKIIFTGLTLGLVPQAAAMQQVQGREQSTCKKISNWCYRSCCIAMAAAAIAAYALPYRLANSVQPELLKINPTNTFNSDTYGQLIPISTELQDLSSPGNFDIVQPLSSGNNSMADAFFNLAAIEKLYKDEKAITSANIDQERKKRPIKTIACFKPFNWFESASDFRNFIRGEQRSEQLVALNWVRNCASVFFPKNNINFLSYSPRDMQRTKELAENTKKVSNGAAVELLNHYIKTTKDIDTQFKKTIEQVIRQLNTHGIAHIMFFCDANPKTISIIKTNEGNYLILYMDNSNSALSPLPDIAYSKSERSTACYEPIKTLIINLKDAIDGKPTNSLITKDIVESLTDQYNQAMKLKEQEDKERDERWEKEIRQRKDLINTLKRGTPEEVALTRAKSQEYMDRNRTLYIRDVVALREKEGRNNPPVRRLPKPMLEGYSVEEYWAEKIQADAAGF